MSEPTPDERRRAARIAMRKRLRAEYFRAMEFAMQTLEAIIREGMRARAARAYEKGEQP